MRAYAQLTLEQRYPIHAFMKAGFTQKTIAKETGVHPSTISREVSAEIKANADTTRPRPS